MSLSSNSNRPPEQNFNENQTIDWLRLNLINGLGPRLRQQLLEFFDSPANILGARESQLRQVPGIGPNIASAIVNSNNRLAAQSELHRCRELNIGLVFESDENYPANLREIPDPPGILYSRGEIIPADSIAIAIVGTRHASQYGLGQAEQFATGLARAGFTIVSGLARGIDTVAHQAALEAGGRTIAVLGSSVTNVYPPENKRLADDITKSGAVISESSLDSKPKGSSFPQRNRIVTGLSLGVIVVEAAARSGALISAHHAMEQNREVFAVPGRVDSRTASGCHHLIRDGAKLVEHVDHVLEELGPLATKTLDVQGHTVLHPAELQLNEQERLILDAIVDDSTSIDQIVSMTQIPVHRVLATISVLEMKRLITRLSGTLVSRNQ
ncbi:DNA-processing protein DprA [Pirellulaceae bacterium]|jgi:DNA processing protein|nr:DNA-processing protein DprA [Pirellulaceae bacterium]